MGSGREDFFLLLAFLIKEWRVNEIEREKGKGGLFGLGILWIIKIIHPSKRDFRFIVFVFCFHLREREREEERKGGKQKGRRRRDGGKKKKKERERERREGKKGFMFERERNLNHQNKTNHFF